MTATDGVASVDGAAVPEGEPSDGAAVPGAEPSDGAAVPGAEPTGAPSDSGLPDGARVRLARRTSVLDGGAVLVGGAPTRVMRLSTAAQHAAGSLATQRELVVSDAITRGLAARLVDAGLAEPVASSLPARSLAEMTVVVPVRDRARQLARLLASIPSEVAETIVVDDESRDPAAVAAVAAQCGATLIALTRNVGSAGARNEGLRRVSTPFVAFIDSDAVLRPAALDILLRHVADPRVAVVAPRITGLVRARPTWIERYENGRSSLDLGEDGASVRPWTPVAWVSSTCMLGRVALLGEGFDPTMRVGEDVDIVWRLDRDGHRVRYEPAAVVEHEHRAGLRAWARRKFFYGTGADLLAARHPRDVAPVVLAPWAAILLTALGAQRWWSVPVAAATAVVTAARIARRLPPVRRPAVLATRLTLQGALAAIAQGVALVVRHWWPAAAAIALVSRRARRVVLIAAAVDAAWEYLRLRPRLDPLRFAVARRIDDLAYGSGVWWGAIRSRSLRALLPAIVRRPRG